MADGTIAKPRPKARETVTDKTPPDREPAREPVRPGMMTFTHPITGEVLTRESRPTTESPYAIPLHIIPDGMVYQWRRESTAGEPDPANIAALKRNGWREVPADRHPEYPVRLDGLVLMECPAMFVERSRQETLMAALAEKKKQGHAPQNVDAMRRSFDDAHPYARQHNFARREGYQPSDPSLRPQLKRDVDIDG